MSYSESIAIAKVLHIRTSFCCQNDFVKIEMNKIAILSFYNLLMGYSNQSILSWHSFMKITLKMYIHKNIENKPTN